MKILRSPARNLFTAAAVLFFACLSAHAQADAPVQQFLKAFNTGDIKSVLAAHVAAPSITDEVPPYHWQGPGSVNHWMASLDQDAKAKGITEQSVVLGAATRKVESPTSAYLVFPATYSFKLKGVAMTEVAQMTFIVKKEGTTWKIAAWTWTGPDPTPAN